MARKKSTKQWASDWQTFKDNHLKGSPIDLNETPSEKRKRIKCLEADHEAWFKYYFPTYYKSAPAPFHIKATKRIMKNDEWYEVRSWSRELAKSTRTMMEVLKLVLTERKKNTLLVSSSYDNAERLLTPYKTELETNKRIENDYGIQPKLGAWESGEFKTKNGASFRALGKGQSPRGTRNDAVRPDIILIDDIDTDEEVRNADRIKESMKWIEKALLPTRSISEPTLILACGNIIAKFCCITEIAKKADKHEIINIRDEHGKSTWPQKNSEAHIDRVLSKISYNAAQGEYFNNPVNEGDTFKELTYDKIPLLKTCDSVLVYADPATSNKDSGNASDKAVGIIARKGAFYYVYKVWLDTMSNSKFIDALIEAYLLCKDLRVDTLKVYIENNSLQNPFYEQVLIPLIRKKTRELNITLPITPDTRKKPHKYTRIEGTLEPLNRLGNLIFNVKDKENPNMQRLDSQMLGVSPKQKKVDGPDMVEGGVWILQNRTFSSAHNYIVAPRTNRKY
ncbi:hypothetical protein [Tenacibaculum piscium]|uniref:hypothetical protein n=1 Tax=Tenacibaculum piscium TaxID=1458515 RepID=UPI001F162E01|nr:hypothetical protein [Tenacibaculum piscium]